MDTKQIQRNITDNKRTIISLEESLVIHRERLARAEIQLDKAEVAESKKPGLQSGDYGTAIVENQSVKWIYGGTEPHPFKVYSLLANTLTFRTEEDMSHIIIRGNIFREMEK